MIRKRNSCKPSTSSRQNFATTPELMHFRQPLLRSPFYHHLAKHMKLDDWSNWAGYAAAKRVFDQELEYTAIRNSTSVFDLSPMIKYRIEGRDAQDYLDRLTLRNVAKLAPGQVHYTAWCDDDGKLLDDGTLFRFSNNTFRLCCQERHLPWLQDSAIGFDVKIFDETSEIAALALQGPTSCWTLMQAGYTGIEDLMPFSIAQFKESGKLPALTISRTGFTGDLGYELFVNPQDANALWNLIMRAGRARGVHPIGTAALNIARIEAGFISTNSEFTAAEQALRPNRTRSPFEAGLAWMIDFEKPYFNGRRALKIEREEKTSRHVLVGLEIEGNIPAELASVYYHKKKDVGIITAAAWSPMAKRNIALAVLKRPYGSELKDDLWTEIYALRELEYEKLWARAKIVERPFIKLDRRRATPPADV